MGKPRVEEAGKVIDTGKETMLLFLGKKRKSGNGQICRSQKALWIDEALVGGRAPPSRQLAPIFTDTTRVLPTHHAHARAYAVVVSQGTLLIWAYH